MSLLRVTNPGKLIGHFIPYTSTSTLLRPATTAHQSKLQRRWATVHDVRIVRRHLSSSADAAATLVTERYKGKLDAKARQEGHQSIDRLKEAYRERIEALRRRAAEEIQAAVEREAAKVEAEAAGKAEAAGVLPPGTAAAASTGAGATAQKPALSAKAASSPTKSKTGIKPLSSYIDIAKTASLPPKEVEALWRLRHAGSSSSVCAAIPLANYQRIATVARRHPQFVLPLPRPGAQLAPAEGEKEGEQGSGAAEMHFLQWGFHPPAATESDTGAAAPPPGQTSNTHTSTVIFTSLAAFKSHGAFAEPHTVLTHHLDLADTTGLVLMNGSVLPERGVGLDEAKLLVMWLQSFYDWGADPAGKGGVEGLGSGGRKGELLRKFTNGDIGGFKVEDLMDEVERVG